MRHPLLTALIACMLALSGILTAAGVDKGNAGRGRGPEKVLLKRKKTDTGRFPQAPPYSPLYCIVEEGRVTVYCEYEATGQASIIDTEHETAVVSAAGALGDGLMIVLPAARNEVRLEVDLNGDIYFAILR